MFGGADHSQGQGGSKRGFGDNSHLALLRTCHLRKFRQVGARFTPTCCLIIFCLVMSKRGSRHKKAECEFTLVLQCYWTTFFGQFGGVHNISSHHDWSAFIDVSLSPHLTVSAPLALLYSHLGCLKDIPPLHFALLRGLFTYFSTHVIFFVVFVITWG